MHELGFSRIKQGNLIVAESLSDVWFVGEKRVWWMVKEEGVELKERRFPAEGDIRIVPGGWSLAPASAEGNWV